MRKRTLHRATALLIVIAGALSAQVNLNRTPSRAIGHPQLPVATANPNLIEGRELYGPQSIAIDTSVNPPVLYVSDFFNNRILGWRNASDFSFGQKADFVIGQKDFFSTPRLGPGTTISTGLYRPTGLAVDRSSNLYVIDGGNNRVLRFPRPYAQSEQLPNLVIGQANYNGGQPNPGGVTAKTIFISQGGSTLGTNLTFDSNGNLWLTDAGNHRVLRYPASALGNNASNNPAADLVLGQVDFTTNTAPTSQTLQTKVPLLAPSGIVFDPAGRLFVSDSSNRVAVFPPNLSAPFDNGRAALRVMGIVTLAQGQQPPPSVNEVQFSNPQSLFMVGSNPGVVDAGNNRLLLFDPFDQWPADGTSPHAKASTGPIGQFGYSANKPNRNLPEAGRDTLNNPSAAVATSSELFVADSGNNRVLVFPVNNLGQNSAATRVLGQDQFHLNAPNLVEGREMQFVPLSGEAAGAVIVDPTSDVPHLYVADTYNHRVLGFRDSRKLRPGDKADIVIGQVDLQRTVVNFPTNDPNQPNAQGLYLPVGLALDSAGNLYVADSGNGRVLRFPQPFEQSQPYFSSADLVLGQSNFTSTVQDPTARTMRSPYGLAFAGENGLLVSDFFLNRVLFFGGKPANFTNGMSASKVFGQPDFNSLSPGNDTNRMNNPKHVATDTDDRLYVADEGNNRILIFDRAPLADNNPRAGTILQGPSLGNSFSGPRGIFVSKITGEIWTTEVNAQRLIRFPKFDDLLLQQNQSNLQIASNASVAVCLDSFGDLFSAEGTNRIAIYFPGITGKNAANYITGRAVAPGTITYVESQGARFSTDEVVHSTDSWPTVLNNTQVLVNDAPAPINWVYPDKLSFIMPMSAPTSGTVEVQVVRQSTGQILGVGQLDMAPASPALFTLNSSGTGQIAAYNDDGTLNQPSQPISRGKYLSIYGTGQGFVANAPPDGQPAPGILETEQKPRIFIGSREVDPADIQYSGLAPQLVGIWQINVKIPDFVAPANAVVLFVQMRSITSTQPGQITTIAVKQ